MVLVSKDLTIDDNDHRKKLSDIFARYKYQTFDKSKDTSTSIMNKINTFIEKVFRGSREDAIPRFDSFVEPMITNVLLVTFCNIQLKWGYDNNDLYGTSIDFYKSKEDSKGKTVKGFCISGVKKCAAAIFDDEYLVLRIPVNRIGNALFNKKEKEKQDPRFTKPWRKDPDGSSRLEEIDRNFMYFTVVSNVSRSDKENILANTEFDQSPQNLREKGEKIINKSFHNPILCRTVDLYVPNIECTTEVEVANIKREVFDKKMIHFAKEVDERNITINRVAAKTTVKINKEGIVVKGICSEYCEDCCVEEVFRPLRMILDLLYMR